MAQKCLINNNKILGAFPIRYLTEAGREAAQNSKVNIRGVGQCDGAQDLDLD